MRHGIIRGWILGITRIFRCIGGVYEGGADPVPERISLRAIAREYRTRFRFSPARVRLSRHHQSARHNNHTEGPKKEQLH